MINIGSPDMPSSRMLVLDLLTAAAHWPAKPEIYGLETPLDYVLMGPHPRYQEKGIAILLKEEMLTTANWYESYNGGVIP